MSTAVNNTEDFSSIQQKYLMQCSGDVRGLGLFWAIELVKDRDTKEPLRRATEKYPYTPVNKIAEYFLQEKNIYIPADKYGIWIVQPLIVTEAETDFLVEAIDNALAIIDTKK